MKNRAKTSSSGVEQNMLRMENTPMATMSMMNIFLRPMRSVRYPPAIVPTKMPSMTDAPMAPLQNVSRLNIGVIWVSATPMSEST